LGWSRIFAHDLLVGVVVKQRHSQHEVDDPLGGQPAAALGPAGFGEHLVDEIAVPPPGFLSATGT
jgi:hypothetical protein